MNKMKIKFQYWSISELLNERDFYDVPNGLDSRNDFAT